MVKLNIKSTWLSLALLVVAVSAIYSNSLHNSFHYDDFHTIVENYFIRNIKIIPELFSSNNYLSGTLELGGSYRPLLVTSYVLNYSLGKLDPFGYHVVNMIIHICMSVILFLFADRLSSDKWTAFFAALLFAVTPFNSETVNYITARSSSLSALFYLLAVYFFILWCEARQMTSRFFLGLAVACFFVCSVLVKESSITLPFVCVAYWYLFEKQDKTAQHRRWFYFAGVLVSAFVGYFAYLVLPGIIFSSGFSIFYKASTMLLMFGRYVLLFLFPVNLNLEADVLVGADNFWSGRVLFYFLFAAALVFMAIKKRSDKNVFFLSCWYVITIAPVLCLALLFDTAVFQENRGYLSAVSFAILFAMALRNVRHKTIYAAVIIIALSMASFKRNEAWKTELTSWTDVVAKNARSYKAHGGLAVAYQAEGNTRKAIEHYQITLRLHPESYHTYHNLGSLLFQEGDLEGALGYIDYAIKLKPNLEPSHFIRGRIMMQMQKDDEAIKSFKEAIRYNPNNKMSYNNLGYLFQKKRMFSKALEHYQEFLRYDPDSFDTLNNVGSILLGQGRVDESIPYLAKAVKIKSDFIFARMNLARAYKKQSKSLLALEQYEKVLDIDKTFAEAYYLSALLYQQAGRLPEAGVAFGNAVKAGGQKDKARYAMMIKDAALRKKWIDDRIKPR